MQEVQSQAESGGLMNLVAGVPPIARRVQCVSADTLHRVAATLWWERAFGRRATVAAVAVLPGTLSATTQELTFGGCRRNIRQVATVAAATVAVDALALPGPGQEHLAASVVVEVGIAVETKLTR